MPDNDEDGGVIQQAIANLTQLRDAIDSDFRTDTSWFTTGPWYTVFLKLLTPLIPIGLIFLFILCCVIPCCKALIARTVGDVLLRQALYYEQLTLLTQDPKARSKGWVGPPKPAILLLWF